MDDGVALCGSDVKTALEKKLTDLDAVLRPMCTEGASKID
jgi:hypothetical protein